MSSEDVPRFNAETLYKIISKYPYNVIFTPALKTGALTGTIGLLTGGVGALLRSSPTPTLFVLASGIQWFALGSTFSATRSTLLWHWNSPSPTPQDRKLASTCAGGITGGTIGGLLRGRRNILPGALMFTIFGYLGQTIYNRLDEWHYERLGSRSNQENEKKQGLWNRIADMKWSPMKRLSNEEYGNMLREKLLRIDAEIALVDDEVERLRREEAALRATEDKHA